MNEILTVTMKVASVRDSKNSSEKFVKLNFEGGSLEVKTAKTLKGMPEEGTRIRAQLTVEFQNIMLFKRAMFVALPRELVAFEVIK